MRQGEGRGDQAIFVPAFLLNCGCRWAGRVIRVWAASVLRLVLRRF
jgi:hypothetical protein